MKKKHLVMSLGALAILAASVGGVSSAYAASNNSSGKMLHNKTRPTLTTEQQSAIQAKADAIKAALSSGNYTAWAAAEKEMNPNSPVLSKINEGNFSRYVEAWNLRSQADAIMKDLGIDNGGGMGLGRAGGFDGGRGHGQGQGQGVHFNDFVSEDQETK